MRAGNARKVSIIDNFPVFEGNFYKGAHEDSVLVLMSQVVTSRFKSCILFGGGRIRDFWALIRPGMRSEASVVNEHPLDVILRFLRQIVVMRLGDVRDPPHGRRDERRACCPSALFGLAYEIIYHIFFKMLPPVFQCR